MEKEKTRYSVAKRQVETSRYGIDIPDHVQLCRLHATKRFHFTKVGSHQNS
jgi:hypothetical protein